MSKGHIIFGGVKLKHVYEKELGFFNGTVYGIVMGIFEVVPGISGGTLAFVLGIYEILIEAISNIKKEFKKSITILFPTLLGMGIGVYCFSFILSYLNKNFPMEVNFWLTGLIIGIIPSITIEAFNNFNIIEDKFKNKDGMVKFPKSIVYSSLLAFILTTTTMFIINYISFKGESTGNIITDLNSLEYLKFAAVGFLAAFCLMLPGCSGSLIMLVFGTYYSVIEAIHSLNFKIIITVGIGVLLGLLLGAKIISYFLKNFREATFFAILGLIVGSSISPFLNFLKTCYSFLNLEYLITHGVFSILTLALGVVFSVSFSSNYKKKS